MLSIKITSIDLIVNRFVVHKIIEQLIASLWLGLGNHMSCSLHCYRCDFLWISLIETSVLTIDHPWSPPPFLFKLQFVQIFFSIGKRYYIIPISTKEPSSNTSIRIDHVVLIHGPPLSNIILQMTTNTPIFVCSFNMERNLIKIPIRNSSVIWRTVWYFLYFSISSPLQKFTLRQSTFLSKNLE